MTPDAARAIIERWFRDALDIVEPRRAVQRALSFDGERLSLGGKSVRIAPDATVVVLAVGKAASAMAQGAHDVVGERIDRGIVLTKDGHIASRVDGFEYFEASHPVPDERGVAATREIVDAVDRLEEDDLVIALISGGGSALLEMPREPLTLDDIQRATTTVMHAGAGINELNAVRRRLSEVKGGGLRRHIGEARCVSLLLSDVLGNDPRIIASGPTVIVEGDEPDAREVVDRLGVAGRLPERVRDVIDGFSETGEAIDTSADLWDVIADNELLVKEVVRLVKADGLTPQIAWEAYDGEAVSLGKRLVADARDAGAGVDVLVGGGEATVEVRGEGKGGRNTEAALAAAVSMTPEDAWVFASLASDGDDGAADAAGAIAGPDTVSSGARAGVDADAALADNDSATFFRKAGGLVETGPTGTNVNDVYIAVRLTREEGE